MRLYAVLLGFFEAYFEAQGLRLDLLSRACTSRGSRFRVWSCLRWKTPLT